MIPGSHKEFHRWGLDHFDPGPSGGKRGIRYDLLTPELMPQKLQGITTHMQAGDAFVWDSRTLHGACKGSAAAGNGSTEAPRLGEYTSNPQHSLIPGEISDGLLLGLRSSGGVRLLQSSVTRQPGGDRATARSSGERDGLRAPGAPPARR